MTATRARAKNKIGNGLDSLLKNFSHPRNKKILHSAIATVYATDSADAHKAGHRRLLHVRQKIAASIKMETAFWL
jgi:hypothetical protein